jgi:hypothetical protein
MALVMPDAVLSVATLHVSFARRRCGAYRSALRRAKRTASSASPVAAIHFGPVGDEPVLPRGAIHAPITSALHGSAWHVGTADGQLRGDKIAMNLPEADDEPEPSLHDRFPDGGGRPGGKPWTFSECSATAPDNIRRDGRLVECLQLERVHRFSLSDEMVGCLTSS